MKKILLLSLWISLFTSSLSWAAQDNISPGLLGSNMCITTYTSEPCGVGGESGWFTGGGGANQMARYACTVCGPNAFIDFISSIYKFVYFISLILWVLTIVLMGIGMSMSGVASEELKTKSKERIGLIISGLIAMGMIPWILKTVAPFFFQ